MAEHLVYMLLKDVQVAHAGLDKLGSDQLSAVAPRLAISREDTIDVSSFPSPDINQVLTNLPRILPNLCERVLLFHSPMTSFSWGIDSLR